MVNRDRLAETFKLLVEIDSVSKNEADLSHELVKILEKLGAETVVDNSGLKTGSNTGNLIARFKGNIQAPPVLFNAHMDTVEPGNGVTAILKDGIFTSDGSTILGADDKSAIAIIVEALQILQDKNIPYGPLEILFTTCEEVGLLGAKHLDYSLISSKYGYALDATDIEGIVTRAPAAAKLEIKVHGKDAHAGAAPENGINAIWLASKAISELKIGRIDHETTCNIGMIEGGVATNIVPNLVTVQGEVRSHSKDKLKKVTDNILDSFKSTITKYKDSSIGNGLPRVEIDVDDDFPNTNIPEDHHVVSLAKKAAENIGMKMDCQSTGGGADANVFFSNNIVMGVLGTGMEDMHTVREYIKLDDMVKMTELVLEIIKLHTDTMGQETS